MKSVTTAKAGLIAPAVFWMSWLISTVGINLSASQAIAETNDAISVRLSEKPLTTESVNSVAQRTLAQTESGSDLPKANVKQANFRILEQAKIPSGKQKTTESVDRVKSSSASPQATFEVNSATNPSNINSPLAQINLTGGEDNNDDPMSQVTSTSQLTDVQPTDWAFQALQRMVERYGCISGYPDGTFRGNRALSRYEFAAGLNACLNKLTQLINSGNTGFTTKEDLATLQRLQSEFAGELATLQNRVDNLQARTTELEQHQFSTTTKLNGLAWVNFNFASANGSVRRNTGVRLPSGQPEVQFAIKGNTIMNTYDWLEFDTSFTGKDTLVLQLAMGNGRPLANNYASQGLDYLSGAEFTDQAGGANINDPLVLVRELFYQFPVGNNVQVVVGPRFNFFRFFDYNVFSYYPIGPGGVPVFNYLTFASANSTLVNAINRGAGAVVYWNINKKLELHLGYLGESDEYLPVSLGFNSATDPSKGLFGGTNTSTAELVYKAGNTANLRFLYTYSHIQQVFGQVGYNIGPPLLGIADDGFGGPLNNSTAHTFEFNFDWLLKPGLGIFGRYAYGSTNIYPKFRPNGQVDNESMQFGLAFPNLGKRGAMGTLTGIVPDVVLSGHKYLVSGYGNGGTEYDLEAAYYYPITDNIAILPSFDALFNINNFTNNPTVFIGNLRTQFSF